MPGTAPGNLLPACSPSTAPRSQARMWVVACGPLSRWLAEVTPPSFFTTASSSALLQREVHKRLWLSSSSSGCRGSDGSMYNGDRCSGSSSIGSAARVCSGLARRLTCSRGRGRQSGCSSPAARRSRPPPAGLAGGGAARGITEYTISLQTRWPTPGMRGPFRPDPLHACPPAAQPPTLDTSANCANPMACSFARLGAGSPPCLRRLPQREAFFSSSVCRVTKGS